MKNKILAILLVLAMCLSMLPMSVFAAETEDYITVYDKSVYAGQYFAGGSGAVDSVAFADNYLHYEGDGKILLKNFVHSDTSVKHAILTDNKDVSLTLIGESELTNYNGRPSVVVNNGKLQISGDGSLKGNGGISCGDFELSGGTVTVDGVTSDGDISITDGELTLTSHALKAIGNYDISITGGKVTVSGNRYAIFATGENGTVSITGGEVELTAVVSGSGGDKAIFTGTLTIGENMQILAGSSAADAAVVGSYNDEMYVKITPKAKDLIVTGGTAGTDYTYENGVLDIKAAGTYEIKNVDPATATGDIIKVSAPSETVNITLNGVVINVSATDLAAFEITGECTTKLILKDGSKNSLDSGVNRAGIANHSHNLIITCENAENANHICSSDCGVLRAIGQSYGAGIGGDMQESGSNITITGGNIVADIVDSQGGAGIGGGLGGNGSNITISGGTVTATSASGAGIGGGANGIGDSITISGGTVTATSASGAGIGGGANGIGDSITISGGTVTATSVHGVGIGGHRGNGSNIKIAPAANTQIYAYNGSDNTGTALTGSPFTTETDITSLLSGNAFYSEAQCIHADTDTDHNCDFGCGETMGTHGDTDNNHACDYGCSVAIGEHADSDTDADHVCDYGCGATLENCTDAVNDDNHSCDVCGKADVSEHTYGDATCEDPAACSECGATTGDALGHKDNNKDHTCDRGCGKTDMGTHGDTNLDHACDYGCAVAIGTCDDADKDHDCDYGCDKYYGTHGDTNKDHACDYGCTVAIGTCDDADKDHDCDYGCDKYYGTHGDTNKDHGCDYGCTVVIGTCADSDKDHDCDYGCDKYYGTHGDTNKDHGCDYGCTVAIGTCADSDKDHDCDYGCDTAYGTHADANKDHACDYGCAVSIGTCDDADKDHDCDYGCNKTFGTHAQATGKHTCDYCDAVMSSCKDDDDNHICDICGAELTHDYSTEWKSDGTNHWHECSCGAKTDVTAHTPGTPATHTTAQTCTVCDYVITSARGHNYSTEWESDGTNHWHECSCGAKKDTTAHTFTETVKDEAKKSDADCLNAAVYYKSCSVCGFIGNDTFTSGEANGHSFTNYVSDGNAACTADGTKTAKCDNCDVTDTVTDTGSAKGHSFTDYQSDNNASCTADGTKTATCDGCDETDTQTDTGSKKSHTYENGTCTVCGEADQTVAPPTNDGLADSAITLIVVCSVLVLAGGSFAVYWFVLRKKKEQ